MSERLLQLARSLTTARNKFIVATLAWSTAVTAAALLMTAGVPEHYTLPALVIAIPLFAAAFSRNLSPPARHDSLLEIGSVTLAWQPAAVAVADYVRALSAASGLVMKHNDPSRSGTLTLQHRESESLPGTAIVIDLYGVRATALAEEMDAPSWHAVTRRIAVELRTILANLSHLSGDALRGVRTLIRGAGGFPTSLRTARAHLAVHRAVPESATGVARDPARQIEELLRKYELNGMRAEVLHHKGNIVIMIVPAGEDVERQVRTALETSTFSGNDGGA